MIVVYMAHPVRGDVQQNLARGRRWVRYLETLHPDWAVVATWIIECEIWNDDDPAERAAGMARNLAVIERCNRLVLVGGRITDGMRLEINHAKDVSVLDEIIIDDLTWMGEEPPDPLATVVVQQVTTPTAGTGLPEVEVAVVYQPK